MNELTRDKYLLPHELSVIKAGLDLVRKSRPEDVALIDFLLASGARCSEALLVTPSDFNDTDCSIYLRGTKCSMDREVFFSCELYKSLRALCKDQSMPIFPFSYSTLSRLWREFCPGKKTAHSARHTAAITLYLTHRDIRLVQLFLGHRSIANTEIYTKFIYSRETLKKAQLG